MTHELVDERTRAALEAWASLAGDPYKMALTLTPETRLAVAWLGEECKRLEAGQ